MKRRSCELCKHTARIYCESDKASLCYDCDQNVHSANFLVAKHSRTLLCHKCQSPTPWVASGLNLGRAASLCLHCIHQNSSQRRLLEDETSHRRNDVVAEEICSVYDDLDDDDVGETDSDDEEQSQTDDNADEEDEEEDGESQVVPWFSLASTPTAASSNNVDFCSSRFSSEYFSSAMKPKREGANLDSEDDTGSSSERFNGEARTEIDDDASSKSFRTSKVIRPKRVRY